MSRRDKRAKGRAGGRPVVMRPLMLSQEELRLLERLISGYSPNHYLLKPIKQLLSQFVGEDARLRELVAMAQANGFLELEKGTRPVTRKGREGPRGSERVEGQETSTQEIQEARKAVGRLEALRNTTNGKPLSTTD